MDVEICMHHLRLTWKGYPHSHKRVRRFLYKGHALRIRRDILRRSSDMGGIAENWKVLSGENNWEGLLDPLDINLRRYIIHYGERVQAISDSINHEEFSKMYGFPRYPPEQLFSKVGLQNGNPYKYSVPNYLYAMSVIDLPIINLLIPDQSAWIGYVAVATDEGKQVLGRRDILISWRGTQGAAEWIKDFEFCLVSASDIFGDANDPKVENGFHSVYTTSKSDSNYPYSNSSAREQVLGAVRTLVDKYKDEEISITVTGHSLGAALATLNAADIVANGYNKPTGSDIGCTVTAFVFGSPHVGDSGFKSVFDGLNNLHLLRIRNANDEVPDLPPFSEYVDVGRELKIDTSKSQYLKKHDKYSSHNLENYMHGVAGTQGDDKFALVVDRDISLVNKETDLLKADYKKPANWWTLKNKGMLQLDNGSWELVDEYVPDPPSTTKSY